MVWKMDWKEAKVKCGETFCRQLKCSRWERKVAQTGLGIAEMTGRWGGWCEQALVQHLTLGRSHHYTYVKD